MKVSAKGYIKGDGFYSEVLSASLKYNPMAQL